MKITEYGKWTALYKTNSTHHIDAIWVKGSQRLNGFFHVYYYHGEQVRYYTENRELIL